MPCAHRFTLKSRRKQNTSEESKSKLLSLQKLFGITKKMLFRLLCSVDYGEFTHSDALVNKNDLSWPQDFAILLRESDLGSDKSMVYE